MISISRIDHIAQAVGDTAPQVALLEGLFGFRQKRSWDDSEMAYHGVALEMPGAAGVEWHVLAPIGDGAPLQTFLDGPRGPGLHHIAIEVPELGAVMDELRSLGVQFYETATVGGERWVDAFLVPRQDEKGLVFRFVQEPASVEAKGPSREAEGPTLGITAIDHICHAYSDRDALARWYERVLGMKEVWRTPDGEHDDLADLVMDIPNTVLKWEVIQPVGEGSFIERFLETRGPAPHHVTFEVGDWERAVSACEHHGTPMFDENDGETDGYHWRDAFIHPRHTGGILMQLFWEANPGVWVRSDKIRSVGSD